MHLGDCSSGNNAVVQPEHVQQTRACVSLPFVTMHEIENTLCLFPRDQQKLDASPTHAAPMIALFVKYHKPGLVCGLEKRRYLFEVGRVHLDFDLAY